jgi:hypothetical protein
MVISRAFSQKGSSQENSSSAVTSFHNTDRNENIGQHEMYFLLTLEKPRMQNLVKTRVLAPIPLIILFQEIVFQLKTLTSGLRHINQARSNLRLSIIVPLSTANQIIHPQSMITQD